MYECIYLPSLPPPFAFVLSPLDSPDAIGFQYEVHLLYMCIYMWCVYMNHLYIYVCVHVYRAPPSPSSVPLSVFFRWARPRTA